MTITEQRTATRIPPNEPPLSLEARLAAADALMTVRLQQAGLAVDVNTAHLPGADIELGQVLQLPVAAPAPTEPEHSTPIAGLLQRAHRLLADRGWCADRSRNEQGAVCLAEAIHKAAGGDRGLEMAGLNLLLEQIRRDLDPDVATVPSWNDRQRDARMPLRILGTATDTAANRGI